MKSELEKFRTRWMRWLGQKCRAGGVGWVDLLDSNYSGWACNIIEKHNLEEIIPNINPKGSYDLFKTAIKLSDMSDLYKLDELYCQDMIKKRGL